MFNKAYSTESTSTEGREKFEVVKLKFAQLLSTKARTFIVIFDGGRRIEEIRHAVVLTFLASFSSTRLVGGEHLEFPFEFLLLLLEGERLLLLLVGLHFIL
jgi:hypothetical protein